MARKATRRRPTPALVISIVALIVACAGTAVGATRYLITSPKQIKPGTITGRNIHAGAISPGQLSAQSIAKFHTDHSVVSFVGTVPAGSTGTAVKVNCPAGEQATGGGYKAGDPLVIESRPDPINGTPTSWVVTAVNQAVLPGDETQTVYVVCAT